MSDGKVTFTRSGNVSEFSMPVLPYTTYLDFRCELPTLDTGRRVAYDYGANYDARSCVCTFLLTAAEQYELTTLLDTATYGRGYADVTLSMEATSGFFPACPDKGDGGPFNIGVTMIDKIGIGPEPYSHFQTTLELVSQPAWPAYTPPAEVDTGPWAFGSVTNLRFPPMWWKPKIQYAVYGSRRNSAATDFVDMHANADRYNTSCEIVLNKSKAIALVDYIADTGRLGSVEVTSDGAYMFDFDKGSSHTFNVRLNQKRIAITHELPDQFRIPLNLNYISTV